MKPFCAGKRTKLRIKEERYFIRNEKIDYLWKTTVTDKMMKTIVKKLGLLAMVVLFAGFLKSCKNNDPSVIKIFVRSASNELVEGAKVIIIGDVDSNPATIAYVDTVVTNNSGFAQFDVQPHYDLSNDKDYTVAYFDIIVKYESKTATGYVRSREHTTAVETVYLPN